MQFMSNPERPDSVRLEPTQELLKNVYVDLYNAIKSPGPAYRVHSWDRSDGYVRFHDIMLTSMDMVEVNEDENTKHFSAR